MSKRPAPRRRQETRAAILECLLRTKGAFRPQIARETQLTEASVSRIVSDLISEGVVQYVRRKAPYVGGPSSFITLSNDLAVAGVELSNNRLSFGIGKFDGSVDYVERMPAPQVLRQDDFERAFKESFGTLRRWAGERGVAIGQVALTIPGYSGNGAGNHIFPWDMGRLEGFLAEVLGSIPLALTNSVVAQAAFNRYSARADYPDIGDHLFLFVGHGVAGVTVGDATPLDAFSPFELGHMVMAQGGMPCRCGHRGCLEAYTSLPAIAEICGLSEEDILRAGDSFVDLGLSRSVRSRLRERLHILGVGLGNALNLQPARNVVVSGWPSLLPDEDRGAIAEGLNSSLLGGFDPGRLRLSFIPPVIGNDPGAALSYAAYCFARAGGIERSDAADYLLGKTA